jgi:hypothetical protein
MKVGACAFEGSEATNRTVIARETLIFIGILLKP